VKIVALRPSLLPGLLAVLDHNVRAGAKRVAIFELGRVFVPPTGNEERRLAVLVWGNVTSSPHWRLHALDRLDFFDLKGVIESSVTRKLFFRPEPHPNLALATAIYGDNQLVGRAGQLSTSLTTRIDASDGVFVAEISVDFPTIGLGSTATFRELGKFPAITRDIAIIAPEELTHEEILNVIFRVSEPSLEKVDFFDRYVGPEAERLFGPGKKSLAYTLTYRDKNRTLTNEEVTEVHARIRERLKRELGVTLREIVL